MLHQSTEATVLSPGLRGAIVDIGTQLESLQPSSDPLIPYLTACEILDVSDQTIRNWVQAGYIPKENLGNRHFFKRSTIETVKDLRSEHERGWYNFVPWEMGTTRPEPRILTRAGRAEAEPVVEIDEGEDVRLAALYQRLVKRARDLREAGKTEAACEMFVLATEVVDEIEALP